MVSFSAQYYRHRRAENADGSITTSGSFWTPPTPSYNYYTYTDADPFRWTSVLNGFQLYIGLTFTVTATAARADAVIPYGVGPRLVQGLGSILIDEGATSDTNTLAVGASIVCYLDVTNPGNDEFPVLRYQMYAERVIFDGRPTMVPISANGQPPVESATITWVGHYDLTVTPDDIVQGTPVAATVQTAYYNYNGQNLGQGDISYPLVKKAGGSGPTGPTTGGTRPSRFSKGTLKTGKVGSTRTYYRS